MSASALAACDLRFTRPSTEADVTSDDGLHDTPAQLATQQRRVLAACRERRRRHPPCAVLVDRDPVVVARCDAEHAGRSVGQCSERDVPVAPTRANATENERQRGLEAADAECREV